MNIKSMEDGFLGSFLKRHVYSNLPLFFNFNGILALTIFFSCLVFSTNIASYIDVPKKSLIQVGLFAAFTAFLFDRRIKVIHVPTEFLAAISLLVLAFVGFLRGDDFFFSFNTFSHWSVCMFWYVLMTQFERETNSYRMVLQVIASSAFCVAVLGWLTYWELVDFIPQMGRSLGSTFGNRNWCAQVLVPAVPAIIFSVSSFKQVWKRCWLWITLSLVIGLLIKINSSAAYLSLFAQMVVAATLLLSYKKFGLVRHFLVTNLRLITISLIVLITLLSSNSGDRESSFQDEINQISEVLVGESNPSKNTKPNTVKDRLNVYRIAIGIIGDSLVVGHGLGAFEAQFPRFNAESSSPMNISLTSNQKHVHNDYIQLIVEIGLIGLLLLFVMGFLIFRSALKQLGLNGNRNGAVLASVCALSGIAINSFFSFPLYNAVPPFFVAIYSAIISSHSSNIKSLSLGSISGTTKISAQILLIVLFSVFLLWRYKVHQSEFHLLRLTSAFQVRDWEKSIDEANRVDEVGIFRVDHLPYKAQSEIVLREPGAALETLDRLDEILKHSPQSAALRASAYHSMGNVSDALVFYTRAYQLNPYNEDFHLTAARLNATQGNIDRALKDLEHGLAQLPHSLPLLNDHARYAYSLGKVDKAIESLEKVLEFNPENSGALAQLGVILIEGKIDISRGKTLLMEAVDIDPNLRGNRAIVKLLEATANVD